MKESTVQSLIQRNFLISSLVPILVIEFLLIVLYFSINIYISSQNQKVLSEEVSASLQQITYREAKEIDRDLRDISRLALLLQSNHERFFTDIELCPLPKIPPHFRIHENGAYYKIDDNGGSSLYYAAATNIGIEEKVKALYSEVLDPLLKDIVDINPLVTQAYLNTHDDMNRLYPFMKDAPSQYGSSINMEDYNFYFLADEQHNPGKGRVWTEAYLDPAGQGWMVSVVVPIYSQGFLEGVSGLDVTIDTIITKVLNLDLPWESAAFLVDSEGVILAMPEKIEQLLSLRELTTHNYQGAVNQTIQKPKDFNLFNTADPKLRSQFKRMFEGNHSLDQIQINDQSYVLNSIPVAETGWRLFVIVDQDSFLLPIENLKNLSQKIGYCAIAVMVLFYILFFLNLSKRSHKISKIISSPIEDLSEQTSKLGKRFQVTLEEHTGIFEIDTLTENFNKMSQELDNRSKALVEEKVRKQLIEGERRIFEELAMRDSLTNLYNRHKIDEILDHELQRTKRYHRDLGIIIVDLDHFKDINDTYGHAIGDQVLVDIGIILLRNSRNSDFVGRWGGEEFLIIAPEADKSMMAIIAEKVRQSIEDNVFEKVGLVTASVGASIYRDGDTTASLFQRADEALYKAKDSGRNCWKF